MTPVAGGRITYCHHRQQDEPGRGGFFGAIGRVDQAVDGRGCEHKAAGEVAHHSDMVSLGGVRRDDHEDTCNDEEIVNDGPPGIGGKTVSGLDLSYNRRDK